MADATIVIANKSARVARSGDSPLFIEKGDKFNDSDPVVKRYPSLFGSVGDGVRTTSLDSGFPVDAEPEPVDAEPEVKAPAKKATAKKAAAK